MPKAIVLFDGVCNLCQSSVQLIVQHDKQAYFQFASLQSEIGKSLLAQHHINIAKTDSIVLIDNDKAYTHSTAALRIAKQLDGLFKLLYVFIIIPTPFRNLVYNLIARNRYQWFGKKEQCWLPSPELKNRFLE